MIVIPALDLLDGQCVRLRQGDYDQVTVYPLDPIAQALNYRQRGAEWLHIIDLNGARDGTAYHQELLREVCAIPGLAVEIGGGIRSLETARQWLDAGAERVIFGTVAAQNPEMIGAAVREFGARHVAVGIDCLNGRVRIAGWRSDGGLTGTELGHDMVARGVETLIYTDIQTDGCLTGPALDAGLKLQNETGAKVVLSGGVGNDADILACAETNIYALIVGRALLDNKATIVKL